MPNIVDLSVNCPSNCSLIGTSSVMRNFLLGKNLPQVPTDIIEAGLVNQWYNDGNLAPEYNNLDPQTLIDIGNVLSDINVMRAQHANLNLYDDYSDEHYNPVQFPNYTQYPLISIDDSHAAVTLAGFGDIESWTDPEEALVNADTWITKWTFELSLNRYSPNDTYNNIPTLASHSDNIVSDISLVTTNVITQFTTTDYNVSGFITTNDPNTIYTPLSYYQQLLQPFNRYQQTANQSYLPSYFGLAYFNYADPNLTPQPLDVNPNHENIDSITDPDGVNITAFPTSNPQGARDWYNTTFNDYSITNVYGGTNISTFYTNGNENFMPANNPANGFLPTEDLKDNIIQNIDGFILEIVPGAGSYGLVTNEPYDPNTLRELNCLSIVDPNTGLALQRGNVYGAGSNSSEITSEVEVVTNQDIYDFNTTQKDAFICYSYVDSVIDPFTYGIQDSRGVIDNILRPETEGQENYLPAQATINVANGVPMDTRFFGTTSEISNALGFVLPAAPIPLDAVLNQIDKNIKDTPLGKTAKAKLASEFFNRIAENLRNEAYGMAEKIGAGLTSLAGNLLGSMVGRDTSFKSGFQQIADAFKRHDITVPKSLLGKAASLVANLAGSNAMLDPIREPISWTSNIPKTNPVSDAFADISRTKRGILNKLFGVGTTSVANDPSEILLAYTSAGQKDFIKASINLNEKYTPFYQLSGFLNLDAKKASKAQKKKQKALRDYSEANADITAYQKEYDEIQKEIDDLTATNFRDSASPKYNLVKRKMRVEKNEEPVISFNRKRMELINKEITKQIKVSNNLNASKLQKDTARKVLRKLQIENPLPFYPIFDDGSFYSTAANSMIEPREFFTSAPMNVDQSGINRSGVDKKDFAKTIFDEDANLDEYSKYNFPIDNKLNVCRYYRNHNAGIAPVESSPDKEGDIETDFRVSLVGDTGVDQIYYKVSDLVKHGVKSTNTQPEDLRGLNIKSIDKENVGYNVYPILPKNSNNNILHQPGLGREDLYEGQSLFSVLESNGFVKISPLWAGDGYGQDQVENVQAKKKRIEESNGDSIEDYKDRVKIHRYMFSLENLAWKGFGYQLPWWERGPNGGRVMWFPPYDLRISDTTSVALGTENLIGRNEPVYTYNHSERSGVLNFKMIMDFPGYHADTEYNPKPSQNTIPQQQQQDITEGANTTPLLAPQSDKVDWDLDNETYIYIMMDKSGSISSYSQTIQNLFIGDNALFRKKLVDEDKIYTADEYKSHVFVFEDPGFPLGTTDNIDDGRFLSWFAAPYFMSIGQDSNVLDIVYDSNTYTTVAMSERLIDNIKSNNVPELLAISSVNKVVVIAVLNECGPAYTRYTTDPGGFLDSVGTTHRFYPDAVDYVEARQNYTDKFKGIILGYDWVGNNTYATLNDMFGILVTTLFGGGNLNTTNINNINVQAPPQIQLESQNYGIFYGETTTTGNYTTSTQTTPAVGQWGDIKYQLEIGAPGNVIGGDEGGDDSETNIVYVLKKALSKDSEKDVKPVAVKKENSHPLIGKLRAYMKRMANDAPNHTGIPEIFVWDDANTTKLTVNEVNKIVGPSESANENVYDIPLYELLTINRNTESRAIQQLDVNVDVNGDIKTVFEWIQSIASNNNGAGFTNKGDFTSDGWKAILKHMTGGDNASNESQNASGLANANPQTDLAQERIPWGIDITDMSPENQLNEFLYFKRIEQSDPLYRDKFKDKILYFDPSFHSITPVGFSNRLNFLEQCARQGPSINNRQASDGTILNANSNLAFGRPPISVLRIGDFYHTRIAIEGVDLSYEPLIFDMNPEGIGVQPMIVDVTINFKYLGGSSLSGPITQLQNAVSNNYFANVEFYHNKALKVFERNVPNVDPQAESDAEIYIDNQNFGELYDDPIQNPQEQQNNQNQDGNNNQNNTNDQNNQNKNNNKGGGKTTKCPVCYDGFTLYDGAGAIVIGAEIPPGKDMVCVPNSDLANSNYTLPNYFGGKPCRTPNASEKNKANKLAQTKGKGGFYIANPYATEHDAKCKTVGCE